MPEIIELFSYIRDKYNDNGLDIIYDNNEILVVFHTEFTMKICLRSLYRIYFNNIFYCDVDDQDIVDTIDDFLSNQQIFCEIKKRRKSIIRVIPIENYKDSCNIVRAWSIYETIK